MDPSERGGERPKERERERERWREGKPAFKNSTCRSSTTAAAEAESRELDGCPKGVRRR